MKSHIKSRITTFIFALCLTGCSTGVVPMGKDTYMVARKGSSWSTGPGLRAACMRDADEFCRKRGLVMIPVSSSGHDGGVGVVGSGEFVFRAVPPDDPEAQKRPDIGREADHHQVIEFRKR